MKVEILTGPPGAGKNTISELVARKRERCVVIDVDLVRWMILQPHKAPWDGEEGKEQQILGVINTAMLVRNFVKNNYDILILDIVSDETIELYRKELEGLNLRVVLLLPTMEEIKKRNAIRPPRLKSEEVEMLYKGQEQLTKYDEKIDNSQLSASEVAEKFI